MRSSQFCWVLAIALFSLASGCKKKKTNSKKFISPISLIREQVAQVDTSLYPIRKIIIADSLSDTSYIKREDFRAEAHDFLLLPDLGDPGVAKKYKEEPAVFDESLNRVIISYTPLDPEKVDLKKVDILVTPDTPEGDKVTAIIMTWMQQDRNGYLKKEMLWQMDKSFQVATTHQLPGQPEQTTTTRVIWGEEYDQ